MSGYPIALRERVVAALERSDLTYDQIAEFFRIGRASVVRWGRLKRETGSVAPRPRGGGNFSQICLDTLRDLVEQEPDRTSFELTASYNRLVSRSERVHRSSVQRALTRMGYVYKKNGHVRQSKTVRTSR